MSDKIDTSAEAIARTCRAAPFADNDAGIPEMVDLICALAVERKHLQARVEQLKFKKSILAYVWGEM